MPALKNYSVNGKITCLFQPNKDFDNNATPPDTDLPSKTEHSIEGLEVQLWVKTPANVFKLGQGKTNSTGDYSVSFSTNEHFDSNGDIKNVFILVYYKEYLVSQYYENSDSLDLIISQIR
jgi:hypothetical protein